MTRRYSPLAERELGNYAPISIATALALESAFGVSEDHPEHKAKPPINNYRAIWFNVRTLLRNLIGAVARDRKDAIKDDDLFDALTAEIQVIMGSLDSVTRGLCTPYFYIQSYAGLEKKYQHCFLKTPKTDLQKAMVTQEDFVLGALTKSGVIDLQHSDLTLKGCPQDSLIVTHMPIDLLSRYEFQRLDLLESHTGKIKPHTQWSSKLTGGAGLDLTRMPFNHVTLQLFGDGVHFQTFPIKEKRQFVDMASKYLWTPTTTLGRMKQCINSYPFHPEFKMILLKMF